MANRSGGKYRWGCGNTSVDTADIIEYVYHCASCGWIKRDWDFGPYDIECPECGERVKAMQMNIEAKP